MPVASFQQNRRGSWQLLVGALAQHKNGLVGDCNPGIAAESPL